MEASVPVQHPGWSCANALLLLPHTVHPLHHSALPLAFNTYCCQVIDITWPVAEGPAGLSEALARVAEEAGQAIDDGYDYIVLSDRRAGEEGLLGVCKKRGALQWGSCWVLLLTRRVCRPCPLHSQLVSLQPALSPHSNPALQAATAWRCPA